MPGRRKKDSQGLWQMFYGDGERDKDVTGRVGASLTDPDAPPLPRDPEAAAALFSVDEDSDQELENMPFIASPSASDSDTSAGPGKKAMVLVSEKELDTSRPFIFKPKSGDSLFSLLHSVAYIVRLGGSAKLLHYVTILQICRSVYEVQ